MEKERERTMEGRSSLSRPNAKQEPNRQISLSQGQTRPRRKKNGGSQAAQPQLRRRLHQPARLGHAFPGNARISKQPHLKILFYLGQC
jgi:hypothetical protein